MGEDGSMRESAREDPGIGLVRVMLGALFLTQFWSNFHDGNFTEKGYHRLITSYVGRSNSPAFWKDVERFIADHASIFLVLQAIGELTLGVLLVLGLVRPLVALAAASLLGLLWFSEIGIYWAWELPTAIVGALAVAISHAGWFRSAVPRVRLLGPPTAGRALGIVAVPLGGLVLAGIVAANDDPTVVAWRAGTTFALVLAVGAALDRVRGGTSTSET